MILKQENQQCTAKGEDGGRRNGDLAVKGQMPEATPALSAALQHVPPDDVADAAEDDQQGSVYIDDGVGGIIAKAVFCDDVNAGVAESGDRGEYGDPDASPAKLGNKHQHIA